MFSIGNKYSQIMLFRPSLRSFKKGAFSPPERNAGPSKNMKGLKFFLFGVILAFLNPCLHQESRTRLNSDPIRNPDTDPELAGTYILLFSATCNTNCTASVLSHCKSY